MSYSISLLNFKLVVYGDKKKKINLSGDQVTSFHSKYWITLTVLSSFLSLGNSTEFFSNHDLIVILSSAYYC